MKSYRESHVSSGMGRRYDEAHQKKVDSHIWDEFIKADLSQALKASAASGATRYLDFACGTGRIMKVGASVFADASGIDVSEEMLEVARSRVPAAKIHCVDITLDPDAVNGFFDCVTMFRFLLNAEQELREAVLYWLSKHMKPGSTLIGNTHQHTGSVRGLVTLIARASGRRDLNHLSRRSVEELLNGTGFRIEKWMGYRVLPSVFGRALFGDRLQTKAEKLCKRLGLDVFGSEQVFIARRI